MLRIITSKSSEQAKAYFREEFSRENYYSEGQELIGQWGGKGAALLGLTGAVQGQAYERLAARVGERVGERTEQKAEWSGGFGNSQGSIPQGERKSVIFRGVVFQGELKKSQSCAVGINVLKNLSRLLAEWKLPTGLFAVKSVA